MSLTTVQPGMLGTPQPYNFKNRIINGAMVFDQRNNGAAVTFTNSNGYSLDRYLTDMSPAGSVTVQQVSDAPSGFTKSLKWTIATATAGGSTQAAYAARHIIEGYNVADLGWGTSSAQTITLSFWVKCSSTGTFSVGVANSAFNRGYAATYTITSANTWEFKSITIPGDTSGTWVTDSGIGVRLYWNTGSGSNYLISAGSWQATGCIGATGSTSLTNTLGATFQITGLQFEVGVTATTFDYRSYTTELQLCQRYFETNVSQGTKPADGVTVSDRYPFIAYNTGAGGLTISFKVEKRTTPVLSLYGGANSYGTSGQLTLYVSGAWTQSTSVSLGGAGSISTTSGANIDTTKSASFTAANTYLAQPVWVANADYP